MGDDCPFAFLATIRYRYFVDGSRLSNDTSPRPSLEVLKSTSTGTGAFLALKSSTVAADAGSAVKETFAEATSPEPLGAVNETCPGITLGVLLNI
jgi:hypothetical protein